MSDTKLIEVYPLSKKSKIKGTRRLAREKVLQLLVAYKVCETEIDDLFDHIYFRVFNYDAGEEIISEKILKPDEVYELEADVPIYWSKKYIEFGKELFHSSLKNSSMVTEQIEKIAKNWEIERIASVDKALITIAISEMLDFVDIPPKVSINEVLDISKEYSTSKSRYFINGVLDSIYNEFKAAGKIQKEGRGLK